MCVSSISICTWQLQPGHRNSSVSSNVTETYIYISLLVALVFSCDLYVNSLHFDGLFFVKLVLGI